MSELIIDKQGVKSWFLNGLPHREGGPAVECIDGYKEWWQIGKLHRVGGPAIECTNGYREWWQNGKLHREDGPAIEWGNGDKEWYYNDIRYSKECWLEMLPADSKIKALFNESFITG